MKIKILIRVEASHELNHAKVMHNLKRSDELGCLADWGRAHTSFTLSRRPNFNPFLTGHHSIPGGRSQIIFHIKYREYKYMQKRCEKKVDGDKCDD